jgi:hypothetical protein
MRCRLCGDLAFDAATRTGTREAALAGGRRGSLRECPECGAELPGGEVSGEIARRWEQLQRCGLAAGARPLLEPGRVGSQ